MVTSSDKALSALQTISPDISRADWVAVAMGAHASGISFDDFDDWSKAGATYNSTATRHLWNSIKPDRGIGAGTLFRYAAGHGRPPDDVQKHHVRARQERATLRPNEHNTTASDIWNRCENATNRHPYVLAKGADVVPLNGLRVLPDGDPLRIMGESMAGALVLPCVENGVIQSLQFITVGESAERLKARGKPTKLNLPGASLAGWYTVGELMPGGDVYVCEGLGTAWVAWKATGRSAVVCFGCGRMRAVAEALRQQDSSARLVLCPDVGKEAEAQNIAAAVGAGVAQMPCGWPDNADLHDLAKSDGIDVVQVLLEDVSVLKAPKLAPRFKLLTCDQLRELPPLKWRVRGVFPDRGLAAIAGPSGSGKSFLAFDLAAHVAGGWEWFGCRVEAAPVVYAALEGEGGYKLRAAAWESNRGQTLPVDLRMMLEPFKLTEAEDVEDLAAVVPYGAVVIVDTLNRAAPTSDENSSRDMGGILEAAKRLQSLIDGLVIVVHHTGKDESRGLRGHSSLFAALDTVVTVKRDGHRREWSLTKSKDGADGQVTPFTLLIETLGTDEYGDQLTSCCIAPSDQPPIEKKSRRMGECEGAVLEFLASAKVGMKKIDVVKHFGGRYEKGPIYRAMKSLVTAQAIHEAAGMVCISASAK